MIETDSLMAAAGTSAAQVADSAKETLAEATHFSKVIETIQIYGLEFCKNLILAIVVLFIGKWIVRKLVAAVGTIMEKKDTDPSLKTFIRSLVSIVLWLLLIIVVIGILGIETSSFIALFASAGVAIGMALSGTLQNFAGGVMILLFRPFKVGDYITAQGYSGTVKEIQIFNTILITLDNQRIIIPNGGLSTGSMVNYSSETTRRVDRTYSLAPGISLEEVTAIAKEVFAANDKILKDPAPYISLELDGAFQLIIRTWCASADYWAVYQYLNEAFYAKFMEKGIGLPHQQVDIHTKA